MKHIISKKNKALLAELVRTDFKLRYQGSVLGYAWSLLRPLLLFLILYLVFAVFLDLGRDVPHYPIYLLLGIVLWNFFVEVTSQGLGSVVGRGDLIRKIRIPRWIVVVSSSVSALINLSLNLVVVVALMLFNDVELLRTALWFPLILLEIYVFAVGLAFYLSATFVKYRDVSYIWEVILQAMFYMTPIIYTVTRIGNPDLRKLLFLNPMAQAIQDARYAIVTHDANNVIINQAYQTGYARLITIGIVVATFIIGVLTFKRGAKYFAENL